PVAGVRVMSEGLLPSLSITGNDGKYFILIGSKTKQLKFSKKNYLSVAIPVSGSFIDVKIVEVKPMSILIDTTTSQYKHSIFNKVLKDSLKVSLVEVGYGLTENLFSSSSSKYLVSGDALNPAYQSNINKTLAGKVPGLKIYGQSDMALGRTGTIGLRGQGGLSTGQSPVYLVDGTYISDINDINYFEIESVSVLSGPASIALLGSKAANGAVLITTKKGEFQDNKGSIEVNTGIMFSNVYILPQYQNSYCGGGEFNLIKYTYRPGIDPVDWQPLDGKYYHDYSDDASWGPKMTGQEYIPWYSWYPGTKYTGTTAKLVPQPDNVRDFYNTGIRVNNSFAFYKSTDDFSVRAVFSNLNTRGLIPYTSLDKNSFVLRTKYKPNERLTIEANINFFTTLQEGEIDDDYSNATTGSFNSWFHRDIDMGKLKELVDLRSPQGYLASWNHNNPTIYDPMFPLSFFGGNYWINHYKECKSRSITNRRDRFYGNISFRYELAEGLVADVSYRRQQIAGWLENKVPRLYSSGTGLGNNSHNYYLTGTDYLNKEFLTAILTYKKDIKDFHVELVSGFEFSETLIKTNSARTNSGLNIPDLYTIQNSRDQPTITNGRSDSKSRSAFVHSLAGYKDFLFIDLTFRKEWLSTLPPNNNTLNVKSIGGSFVFSRLISVLFINSGRLRFSWGETPT
ncbi:MAG: hypothetical protein C0408_08505, partial [Odoribacter sp.]|nr:hypothetical protein [Odoribacter sp.]